MRIAKLLTVVAVMMMALFVNAFDAWAAGPRIAFKYEVMDLGTVAQGQKVTVEFPFRNLGNGTLIIGGVQADCGCTEVYEGKQELPRQGKSRIMAVLDTTTVGLGKKERRIHVRCNDPRRPSVTLTMVVQVVPE